MTFTALPAADAEVQDIIYGAGAHMDPQIAALCAVCEMNQCLTWVPQPGDSDSRYGVDDPMCLSWWKTAKLVDHPYLAPDPAAAPRGRRGYPVPDTADVSEDVERCRALVEARGMEFLVLDQTRPDIRMPVARVIVPGLRHFWERFAPGPGKEPGISTLCSTRWFPPSGRTAMPPKFVRPSAYTGR